MYTDHEGAYGAYENRVFSKQQEVMKYQDRQCKYSYASTTTCKQIIKTKKNKNKRRNYNIKILFKSELYLRGKIIMFHQ